MHGCSFQAGASQLEVGTGKNPRKLSQIHTLATGPDAHLRLLYLLTPCLKSFQIIMNSCMLLHLNIQRRHFSVYNPELSHFILHIKQEDVWYQSDPIHAAIMRDYNLRLQLTHWGDPSGWTVWCSEQGLIQGPWCSARLGESTAEGQHVALPASPQTVCV